MAEKSRGRFRTRSSRRQTVVSVSFVTLVLVLLLCVCVENVRCFFNFAPTSDFPAVKSAETKAQQLARSPTDLEEGRNIATLEKVQKESAAAALEQISDRIWSAKGGGAERDQGEPKEEEKEEEKEREKENGLCCP